MFFNPSIAESQHLFSINPTKKRRTLSDPPFSHLLTVVACLLSVAQRLVRDHRIVSKTSGEQRLRLVVVACQRV